MSLSEYELQRIATIRENDEKLQELGLLQCAANIRHDARPHNTASKAMQKKRKSAARAVEQRQMPTRSTRRSRRGDGHSDLDAVLADADAEKDAALDEKPPKRPRWEAWKHVEFYKNEPLTAAERASLSAPDEWLKDFEAYWRDEMTLSDANMRSVMRSVSRLVAGEGLVSLHREGVFAEGLRVDMHTDLEWLALEAHYFLPMKSMPTWMKCNFPEAPKGGPRDLSNGWFANHPIMKLQIYQRLLRDQAKEYAAEAEAPGAGLEAPAETPLAALAEVPPATAVAETPAVAAAAETPAAEAAAGAPAETPSTTETTEPSPALETPAAAAAA